METVNKKEKTIRKQEIKAQGDRKKENKKQGKGSKGTKKTVEKNKKKRTRKKVIEAHFPEDI